MIRGDEFCLQQQWPICGLVRKLMSCRVGELGVSRLETRDIITAEGVCGLHYS